MGLGIKATGNSAQAAEINFKMSHLELSDSELIRLYKDDSYIAFEELFKRYHRVVYSVINDYIKDSQSANDYSQDIWIHIIKKINKFEGENFNLWIRTVAKNVCIDKFRRNKIRKDIDFYVEPSILERSQKSYDEYSDDFEILIDETYGGLDSLTETQAKVLLLRLKGIPFQDISHKIKISLGTCQPAYQAAVIKLRRHLVSMGLASKELNISLTRNKKNKD